MANIQGTDSADTLDGTRDADRMAGGSGDDRLRGLAGDDTLSGGLGADTLVGGSGHDLYRVESVLDVVSEMLDAGIDWIVSTASAYRLPAHIENGSIESTGKASLAGNGLANLILAGSGNNLLEGGAGNDTLSYASGATAGVDISLAVRTAQETFGSGIDRIAGFENLTGSCFDDFLIGDDAANVVQGLAGNDILRGGGGDDTLIGGAGRDTLVGDVGMDRFIFERLSDSGPGARARDTIAAFVGGDDRIDLSALDADRAAAGDQAFTFIGSDAFSSTDATGQLRYEYDAETDTVIVFGSTDADTAAEFSLAIFAVGWMLEPTFIL